MAGGVKGGRWRLGRTAPAHLATPQHRQAVRVRLRLRLRVGVRVRARVRVSPPCHAVARRVAAPSATTARRGCSSRLGLLGSSGGGFPSKVERQAESSAASIVVSACRDTGVACAWHVRGMCVACAWHVRGMCVAPRACRGR
eukprot:scaffold21323_cov60-Phaeocystis_antarctica.AAC.3